MVTEARTPCQEDPEAWVGDDAKLRAQAAIECLTCPMLKVCAAAAFNETPEFGVWAGVDYTPAASKPGPKPSSKFEPKNCAECDRTFERTYHSSTQWESQRFCSNRCRGLQQARKDVAA